MLFAQPGAEGLSNIRGPLMRMDPRIPLRPTEPQKPSLRMRMIDTGAVASRGPPLGNGLAMRAAAASLELT